MPIDMRSRSSVPVSCVIPARNMRSFCGRCLPLLSVFFACATAVFSQNINRDSLFGILDQQRGVDQVKTLGALASAFEKKNLDSAIIFAIRALAVAGESGNSDVMISSEYRLGSLYDRQKRDSLSVRHLRAGIEKSLVANNARSEAMGNHALARFYLARNDPKRSIELINRSLKLVSTSADRLTFDLYASLGDAYKLLGTYDDAVENYLNALRLASQLQDEQANADMFNSIGTVYHRTGDYDQALDYFDRALQISKRYDNKEAMMSNLLNTGVIHQKRHDYENALAKYRRVLSLSRELGDAHTEAIATGNIGSTLVEQGELKEGLQYLNKALALKEPIRNVNSTLHTLNDIADVKVKLGDARGAKVAAEEVVRLGEAYALADQLRYGYLNLSNSYKLLGDFPNAFRFLEKRNALNDSLFGIQKAQQINELQIQYDTEKKDMAIRSLEQEKRIADARKKVYALTAIVVLVVLGALFYNQRAKAKRNLALLEKEREVDRLKSDFFANISHEFRTPLSLILGPVDTMLEKTREPNQRFQLELMKKSASRLLRLINQILELSKLQFARPELKGSEVNAVEIVKGITSTFQSLADSRGIDLIFECREEELPLYCDQEQIETVCINLISNAFKFSDAAGKITVTLQTLPSGPGQPDGGLELLVADRGIGIPREDLDHIFDRFYRAGSASEKRYGGTGIGLALVKELIELHHGHVSVESELGQGTTVRVCVPLGKTHLRPDQIVEKRPRAQAAMTSEYEISGLQPQAGESLDLVGTSEQQPIVLLIDDNEDIRSFIRSIVSEKYTLLEACNGEEGLRQARAFIPDLIISDVMMPVLDGYETCRRLKKDEKTSHIPVILLTAKTSVRSRIEGLETEADIYLSKPFVPQELLLNIHNLIQSRKRLRDRYNRQVVLKPAEISINSTDELFLQRLMKVIEANYQDENFSVEQLSDEMGMSRSQLHRKLQALTNESASQFIRSFRLQRAMQLLQKKHDSISQIAFDVGFASHPYFNRCFLQQYGCTPSSVVEKAVVASN